MAEHKTDMLNTKTDHDRTQSRHEHPLISLFTIPVEFQWNSTGVMENYWKMTGTNGTSEILLEFQQFTILTPLKFHL